MSMHWYPFLDNGHDSEPKFSMTVEQVWSATDRIIASEGWGDGDHINLVHANPLDQNVHRNDLYRDGIRVGRMSDMTCFNRKWIDSPLHELWQIVRDWTSTGHWLARPYQVARMRIARLRPHRCYSFHNDEDYRFHLPLVTNPDCFFLITRFGRDKNQMPQRPETFIDMNDQIDIHHMAANGRLYGFDANHVHTAINSGKTERIHLLFETVSELNDRPL